MSECLSERTKPKVHQPHTVRLGLLYNYSDSHLGFGGEEGGGHELVRKVSDHCTWSGQLIHHQRQSFLLQPGNSVPVGNGVKRCQVPTIQDHRQDLLHPDRTCRDAEGLVKMQIKKKLSRLRRWSHWTCLWKIDRTSGHRCLTTNILEIKINVMKQGQQKKKCKIYFRCYNFGQ